MEVFVAFKYLHIVSMFFAVGVALSVELVVRNVAGSADVGAIRVTTARVTPLANISTGLFLAGAAFGIVAALTGQINLLAPWLVLASVLFVVAMGVGITITDPWVGKLKRAAAESPVDAASPELQAVIADPRARVGTWSPCCSSPHWCS